jgi:hypothetical protein
MNLCTGEMIN